MRRLVVLGIGAIFFALCTSGTLLAASDEKPLQIAVLVTGASSGIGRQLSEALASDGVFVYAGARNQQDMDELDRIKNIRSIRLDVTQQEDIDAAVDFIQSQGRGLYGLVNNAGVLIAGPNIEVDVERVKWLFDVNVFGVQRVTNAVAPFILESGGRIVNISSIAGHIGIKYLGAYSMSKHAIEAYTDSLAAEMGALGVHVSVVAPGDFSTNVWTAQLEKARSSGLVGKDSPFGEDIAKWITSVEAMKTKKPDAVVAAIQQALFAEKPRRRYLVVPDEAEARWVVGSAVTRLAELNTDQEYAYSPHALAQMLSDIMSEQAGAD